MYDVCVCCILIDTICASGYASINGLISSISSYSVLANYAARHSCCLSTFRFHVPSCALGYLTHGYYAILGMHRVESILNFLLFGE